MVHAQHASMPRILKHKFYKKILSLDLALCLTYLSIIPAILIINNIGTHLCCIQKNKLRFNTKGIILLRKGTIKNKIK